MLACSRVSRKFPDRVPPDRVLLRVFLGGPQDADLIRRDDEALSRIARRALTPLLGIEAPPIFSRVFRFERVMPQFPVGFAEVRDRLFERLRTLGSLGVCGGSVGAVGLPDCIGSGRQAAEAVTAHVLSEPRSRPLAASRA